ncbi:MAG: hypothetical protein HS104_42345 [Polyangiaceae bacterium]|nr:hypothetical protein [Polyangiaceae bacterium]MCL4753174.1 hypothetical protein [Myxococcales bacterium]
MSSPPQVQEIPAQTATPTAERAPEGSFVARLRVGRWGTVLALLTILFGFALGGAFGAFETPLKSGLTARAEAVRDGVYAGDAAKMKSVVDKSWTYYKRAHMHGGAIGAVALGGILLLAALERPRRRARQSVSLALGLGGLGYSSFWLLAARAAPGLGSTDAAKESLAWLAVPSAGLLMLGVIAVIALTSRELFAPRLPA